MNILSIGNSFSEDATRYLHNIARADGEDYHTVNLYVGGCSLEMHNDNIVPNAKVYEWQENGDTGNKYVSIRDALQAHEWDIVTVQQVSHLSFNLDSYFPYVVNLINYIKKYAPNAKVYLHQTWAYEKESDRLINIAGYNTPEKMLDDIIKVNDTVARNIGAEGIIRSGELFELLRKSGYEKLYRDTFHASLGVGRYALALLWYCTISGKKANKNLICDFDEPVEQENIQKIINTVNSITIKHN